MKNVHILPTSQPSRLRYFCGRLERMYAIPKKSNIEYQNIYIISDEEIKEGDWFLHPFNTIHKAGGNLIDKDFKKIILSTDQSLDGVQAIDDEFLEWFVKNPSCKEVEVENIIEGVRKQKDIYKIIIPSEEICSFCDGTGQVVSSTTISRFKTCDCKIIPKEEPNYNMKQEILAEMEKKETIDEVAERLKGKELFKESNDRARKILSEIKSLPIQERSYSEEEVYEILAQFVNDAPTVTKKWFEKFKKK